MSLPPGTESLLACPEAEVLVELARGLLSPDARAAAMAHVGACEECGEVVAAFTGAFTPTGDGSALASRPAAPAVLVGDLLAGKYRVDRILGLGGMGVVVAATNVPLN